ncbi:universal stress protein [Pedococcus sp. KACC 23699]|uniref:Universal stress protein n=1 Tax=Pedococcus sp. KACC 23699 TaxID=3149228 RepID=A0AAU7JSV7_9MICO
MGRLDAQPRHAVVVGVDGSAAGHRALGVAVEQAHRLGRPLHALHATGVGIVPWTTQRLEAQDRIADAAARKAREADPSLAVTRETVVAEPAAALVAASETADLVVVDAGGLGRASGLLLGATSRPVAAHAHCPVLLTPHTGEWNEHGPVVVGVDASEHSVPAIAWAFAEASSREAPLLAVHTWWWEEPDPFLSGRDWEGEWRDVAESQRLEVAEMLAGWQEKYPDVQVATTLVRGHAATVLAEESRDGQLLVVGSRGRGGFKGLLLGSVSASLITHARCPVTVVPSTSRYLG